MDDVKLTRVVNTSNVCSVFFKRRSKAVVTRAIRNSFYPRYESYGVISAKLIFTHYECLRATAYATVCVVKRTDFY